MKHKSILLIAGEISGDMHAATLVRRIQARRPEIRFFGVGGDELRATGMEILYDTRETAVLGITDVLLKIRFFQRMFNDILNQARERRPDAVILVDYPGFNLRLAAKAHAMGLKVIYYICPQVWAWHRERIPKMAQIVDRLISIFPFEKEVFRGSGLKVDVVKHPLTDLAAGIREAPPENLPWKGKPHIALLPGSRSHEVSRMLPVMWMAAALIEKQYPEASFLIAAPNDDIAALSRTLLSRIQKGPSSWAIVVGKTRHALRQARAAWVASGTATVEAALMRCPMVVIYKTAWATYILGRMLVKLRWLGMVNIIAGRSVCPELIQHEATPHALSRALITMIEDGEARKDTIDGLDDVILALGGGGGEAADVVLEELAL